jgi:hypothetical protein
MIGLDCFRIFRHTQQFYYWWKREPRYIIQCICEETTDFPHVNWQTFSHSHIGPFRIRTNAGWRWEVSWFETDVLTTRPWRPPRSHMKCKTNTLTILMHQMRISTTQVSSMMLRKRKLEIRNKMWKQKEQSDENQSTMKLSQIRRRIELGLREIILHFEMNLTKFIFFPDSSFHIRILK